MNDNKGMWDVKGEKAPVWYTKDGKEETAVRVGFVGQFDGNPASPHGEPAEGYSTVDDLLSGHEECVDEESGKMIQHLTFVKVSDLNDEEKGKQLRAYGIRHPGWWRWRVVGKCGEDKNIDAECLVFVHDHEEKAEEVPPSEETPEVPPTEETP